MKYISKILFLATLVFAFVACNKEKDLPFFQSATPSSLSASSNTIATLPADSNKAALTLTWTYPDHAVADPNSIKYVVEIDSTGRNFSKEVSRIVTGSLSSTFTGKELNDILLGFGYAFDIPVDMDVRVTSSYPNNNEKTTSNVVKIRMTPYKVPPKVALPTTGRLFIVGDATDFGWDNPASMPPVRELTRIEETKWGGIFHLPGSGGYLLVPLAGNWDNKFSVANGTIAGLADGGDFGFNLSANFPGNVSGGAGPYKMIFDFQSGKFTVTKVEHDLPADLFMIGDATSGGWTNTPPETQKLTAVTNGVFEITMAFTPGGYYKFLSSSGNWQPQFGGSSATGGDLAANYGTGSDPNGIPAPAVAGNYRVQVNFITNTYTVTKL